MLRLIGGSALLAICFESLVMLRLVADLQGLERAGGQRAYRVYIGIRFASNKKFRFHVRNG
jgi:hypothetical protein